MSLNSIRELVSEDFDAVNRLIIENIQSTVGLIDDLSHHIVQSGGKRLRPLLLLLSAHACQYKGDAHIALAAMVELFHTATLLHDDVVDESMLRRGRQTANSIWGSKASILVGDYLFTLSVELMVKTANQQILELMATTAHDITRGEVVQLTNRHQPDLTFDAYFEVIKAKTALLFAAATAIGAHLGGCDETVVKAMYDYGLYLGNAFQLIDDALDYCSNADVMGKNIGDDLADGKATLPMIYALEHASSLDKEIIRDSLINGDTTHLEEIKRILIETKAIDYTKSLAEEQSLKAIEAVSLLPDSVYKQALINLAQFAVMRDH